MNDVISLIHSIPPIAWWAVGGLLALAITITIARKIWAVIARAAANNDRRDRLKNAAASIALYGLLYFFWAVAAGISMQGLIGFARDNMGLEGPWPYLIFFALDGAAAFCMVLVTKRAARAASTTVPRLAVWGLVAASAWFNQLHAPDNPGSKFAWALIPVIAGVLFELAQAETRNQASDPGRRLQAIQWLHPVERVRVLLELASDTDVSADEATARVRVVVAAAWLYRLRTAWRPTRKAVAWRTRVALARADFSEPERAEEILRRTQIFARTDDFARLDFRTPVAARLEMANLIGSEVAPRLALAEPAQGTLRGSLVRLDGNAPALAPPAVAPAVAEVLPASSPRGKNGVSVSISSATRPNALRFAPATAVEGQGEGQNQGQSASRKRPSQATYRRAQKNAIEFVVKRAREGVVTRWQDVQSEFPSRSRNWCEARLSEGQAEWQRMAASGAGAGGVS